MSQGRARCWAGTAALLTCLLFSGQTAGAVGARPAAKHPPVAAPKAPAAVRVRAVVALDARHHPANRFHRGDILSLRIRWQTVRVHTGEREVILWAVHRGAQVVYRHYYVTTARLGRWYRTVSARIPRGASPGVYTFEGKVVLGHRASWRVVTFRVVR